MGKQEFFENNQGFKIANGHFKLGSRIHIDDYFYARRMFFNSFFTNRFAFLISQYIIENFDEQIKSLNPNCKISLIGYETYSDLLVSNVRKMLNKYYDGDCEKFNHFIYTREKVFLKTPKQFLERIIIITPISTTFSTSLRIKEEINKILKDNFDDQKDPMFFQPFINCLVIGNKNSFNEQLFAKNGHIYYGITDRKKNNTVDHTEQFIESEYGWISTDLKSRIINVKPLFNSIDNKQIVKQKYHIPLTSTWVKTFNCSSCYPAKSNDSLNDEMVLLETDQNALVPKLIFEYPRVSNANQKNVFKAFNFKGKKERVILRQHLKYNFTNYIYYIKSGQFLKNNKKAIEGWFSNELLGIKGFENGKKIVIVTPIGGSSSGFVNLVNDKLFAETATIIQYDITTELIHNFQIFYKDILLSADTVIFVDDVMSTAESFSQINFFIKNVLKNKGVDYALCLVNRLGYHNEEKLLTKLGKHSSKGFSKEKLRSFIKVNVPPKTHSQEFPYLRLRKLFSDLAQSSMLDMMQMHFKERENKFKPINLKTNSKIAKDAPVHKNLFQFLIEHEFNNLFQCSEVKNNYHYNNKGKIIDIFQTNRNSKALVSYISQSDSIAPFIKQYPIFEPEIKNNILKVCSMEPYITFRNIKEAVFGWVLNDLIELVDIICDKNWNKEVFFEAKGGTYSEFDRFKFLLKRGAKLKMNFVYNVDVLKAVNILLNAIDKDKELSYTSYDWDENDDQFHLNLKSRNLYQIGFIIYFVALIQEIIVNHESKAIELVKNIKIVLKQLYQDKNLRNNYDDPFIYLLRLLVLENTFIFKSFIDKYLQEKEIIKKEVISFESNDYSGLTKDLENYKTNNVYIFQDVIQMLSRYKDDGELELEPEEKIYEAFENTVVLKGLIESDLNRLSNKDSIPINEKINTILELCCKVLGVKNGGAFFTIKYKGDDTEVNTNDLFVINEYVTDQKHSLSSAEKTENSIVKKMFDGIYEINTSKPRSTFEVSLCQNDSYEFRKSYNKNSKVEIDFLECEELGGNSTYQNLFFLRIAEITKDVNSPNGREDTFRSDAKAVICFYNKKVEEDKNKKIKGFFRRFNPKKLRLLLLLRKDIRKFINHHFINDTLRAYIEEQIKINEITAPEHGSEYLIRDMEQAIDDGVASWKDESSKEFVYFLIKNFYIQSRVKNNFRKLTSAILEEDNLYAIKPILESNFQLVFRNNLIVNKIKNVDIVFEDKTQDFKISLNKMIFSCLISESFINCKKYGKSNENIMVRILNDGDKSKTLIISNQIRDMTRLVGYKKQKLMEKGFINEKPKGLFLNHLIMKKLGLFVPKYEIREDIFSVEYKFSAHE